MRRDRRPDRLRTPRPAEPPRFLAEPPRFLAGSPRFLAGSSRFLAGSSQFLAGSSRFLAELDQRVLPPLGRALARSGRGARRARVLTMLGTALAVTAVVVAVYTATRSSAPVAAPGPMVKIGVSRGDSIPRYVAQSRADLNAIITAPGQSPPGMYALVAFASYQTPQDLMGVLAGVHVTNVYMRVPLDIATAGTPARPASSTTRPSGPQPGYVLTQGDRIPADVIKTMLAEATREQMAVADYQTLEQQVTGTTDEDRQLRAHYRDLAGVAAREERAYRSQCACVYAAVVYATPAELAALAARSAVRVVDPVPGLRVPDRATFLPPLPEQHDLADPPADNSDTAP